jgi:hypothetical protein
VLPGQDLASLVIARHRRTRRRRVAGAVSLVLVCPTAVFTVAAA